MALFCLTLLFLRWAANALIHTTIEYHPVLQQGGAILFGLLAGYLVSGFLICVAQTLPVDPHFLKFEARIDPSAAAVKVRRILPPDRVWLALMHRASAGPFSWGEDSSFDPDGSYELRYGDWRQRRLDE
jgi:hypothetical protein